jgi:superfamily I DNA/RNA helicase
LKMAAVGLDILSAEREKITRNYRNSRQILRAASLLANKYGAMAKSLDEEIEVLDPELAVRETAKPFVVRTERAGEEDEAWKIARECLSGGGSVPWSVSIVTASESAISVDEILAAKPADLPFQAERISGDYSRAKDTITVGEIADIKGFEFTVVIIVGCGREYLPNPKACRDESWREALHFYVAMTRARDNLYLIHSDNPSEFLETMRPELDWNRGQIPRST